MTEEIKEVKWEGTYGSLESGFDGKKDIEVRSQVLNSMKERDERK